MFAVVKLKGHQYIVSEDDGIQVDNVNEKDKGEELVVEEVLSVFDEDGENVDLGQPYLQDASVTFTVQNDEKGEKIEWMRFKSGERYKKKYGFRPEKTNLKVKKIDYNG